MYHTQRTATATAYYGSHRAGTTPPPQLHKTVAPQSKTSVSPYPRLEVHKAAVLQLKVHVCPPPPLHKTAVPQSKFRVASFKKIFLRVDKSATTVKVILTPPIPQKEPPMFPISWESVDEELWQRTGACESAIFPDPFGMDTGSFFADDTD
ncbi:hypothetical protein BDV98DRAFT_604859 [Pterulicium gracile]|uniref:Uncharacterized protein n=1 Tax=Pterulicium gracile TaxID=1884261 RepID=A0A5C3QG53_9AGAR|nr:hypothetical protein BDV98DRAFT_604859 [Pterula gracilis]